MSAGKAIEDVMARYNVEHSAAYEAVTRVLSGGDKLEAIFHNRGP